VLAGSALNGEVVSFAEWRRQRRRSERDSAERSQNGSS
jgi:hypothetical protein